TFDEEEGEAGDRDDQRHETDVDPLQPGLERVDAAGEVTAHLLELLAHLGLLLPEVFELLLLLRREDELLLIGLRLLELVEFRLGLLELVLKALNRALVFLPGLGLHLTNDGERPLAARTAAHGDEGFVAGELLDGVPPEVE